MDKYEEKTIESDVIYDGNILKLRVDKVKLPDGCKTTREVVELSGAVSIIPVTENGDIIMVKQYRKAAEEMLLELPAGKLEPEEVPEVCAARELEEETGYRSGELKKIFSFYTSPGFTNEMIHMYIARKLEYVGRNLDPYEFIDLETIKQDEIIDLIDSGEIRDGKTISGLMRYLEGDI